MLLISRTTRYWYADTLFAKGKQLNDLGSPVEAREVLVKAIKLSPNEAIFWDELSESDAVIAATLFENGNRETALEYAESAIGQSDQAQKLSPRNLNILRNRTAHFIRLSYLDPVYLKEADHTLDRAILLAPTDAKLMYNKGLMYIRKGDTQTAIDTLKQATRMKPNYKEPRLALGLTFIQLKKYQEAKEEFSYILNKIDPDDKTSKEKLEEIESLN